MADQQPAMSSEASAEFNPDLPISENNLPRNLYKQGMAAKKEMNDWKNPISSDRRAVLEEVINQSLDVAATVVSDLDGSDAVQHVRNSMKSIIGTGTAWDRRIRLHAALNVVNYTFKPSKLVHALLQHITLTMIKQVDREIDPNGPVEPPFIVSDVALRKVKMPMIDLANEILACPVARVKSSDLRMYSYSLLCIDKAGPPNCELERQFENTYY